MSVWWNWFFLTVLWICVWIAVKWGIFDNIMERALVALNVRHAKLSLKFISHFTYIWLFLLYIGGCLIIFGRYSTVRNLALWVGSFGLFFTLITSEIWKRVFSSAAFSTADIVDIADYVTIDCDGKEVSGVIIDVGVYYLRLTDFTGETHFFPTSKLLDSIITNRSFEEGENPMCDIKFTIPYLKPDGSSTNLQEIYSIFYDIIEERDIKKHVILDGSDKQKPIPFTIMGSDGIDVHLRVWCQGKVKGSQSKTVDNLFHWWKMPHTISSRLYHEFMKRGLEFELPVRKVITFTPQTKEQIDKKSTQYIGDYREVTAKMKKNQIEIPEEKTGGK